MRASLLLLGALSAHVGISASIQKPLLQDENEIPKEEAVKLIGKVREQKRPLYGRFLHITDFHPDAFYKPFSSTSAESACHRDAGPAGVFGAETSDCDSPFTLVNATFQWLNDNLKDKIDFVIWTGDSARHDSDPQIPRTPSEVVDLNEMLITKFTEVWGKSDNIDDRDPTNDFTIPIVPTWGNNDIMPHNIMEGGPTWWTRKFSHVWRKFIPEEQRHGFERGGWFFVEVIPRKLAVFSLNTLYFFDSNSAVDGCADKSEPGYEHFEWLRIQLHFLRERGMKAIMMGHVPPARTDSKISWDETCWQKYTLWMQQYRDVVVGSLYGHMNIDHFMLQDFDEITKKTAHGNSIEEDAISRQSLEGEDMTIQSSAEYLDELRAGWASIPDAPKSMLQSPEPARRKKKKKKSKEEQYLEKIGGAWAERYAASLVTASVVPNYFPAFRVFEYNLTGLETVLSPADKEDIVDEQSGSADLIIQSDLDVQEEHDYESNKKHKKKRGKHPKDPKFKVPLPPSKSSPPGPAYSPQTFTWLSYAHYYANLTKINNDFHAVFDLEQMADDDYTMTKHKWREGRHKDKIPKTPHEGILPFEFEVEYDTKNDSIYSMQDLTVRSWVNLASRIGNYRPYWTLEDVDVDKDENYCGGNSGAGSAWRNKKDKKDKKKEKKKRKKEERRHIRELWSTFFRRAYVGTRELEDDLHDEIADDNGNP